MGQYYKIVNVTKKQYINPVTFGSGYKLMEFASDGCSAMTGLAVLLANSNGRGGGDLCSDNEVVGSWAGDRIVIAGDYAEFGDPGEPDTEENLYLQCSPRSDSDFEDISAQVISAMCDDNFWKAELEANPFATLPN